MNDSCGCEIRFNNFNLVIKQFMKQYNDFLKMKRKNKITQQQKKKFEFLYSTYLFQLLWIIYIPQI